jgi:hypothetical protein
VTCSSSSEQSTVASSTNASSCARLISLTAAEYPTPLRVGCRQAIYWPTDQQSAAARTGRLDLSAGLVWGQDVGCPLSLDVLDPAHVIDTRLSLDRHDCSIVSAAGFASAATQPGELQRPSARPAIPPVRISECQRGCDGAAE